MGMSSHRLAVLAATVLLIVTCAGTAIWIWKADLIDVGGTETGQLAAQEEQNTEPEFLEEPQAIPAQPGRGMHAEPDLIFVGQQEPAFEEAAPEVSNPPVRRPRSRVAAHAEENASPLLEFPETTKTESPNIPTEFPKFAGQSEPRVLNERQTQAKRTAPANTAPAQQTNQPFFPEQSETAPVREESVFASDTQPTLTQSRRFPTSVAQVEAQPVPEPRPDPEFKPEFKTTALFDEPKTIEPLEQPKRPRTAARFNEVPESAGSLDLQKIDQQIAKGDIIAAHRELSTAYWNDPAARAAIMPRIEKTADAIYFSPQPHFVEPYVVQAGDRLQTIATKYQLAWPYLASLNKVDPKRIRAGQKLKVIKGPLSAFVDLSDFEITIHAHGFFVKRYQVGIGKDGASPLGKFTVLEKVEKPQYTDPKGKVIAGGHPANPLGTHWIDLGNSYGIHGTIEPDSIGKAESRGCVRMRNEEVVEVYNFLVKGSEVVIRQ